MNRVKALSSLMLCAGLGLAASAHAEGESWYVVAFAGEASVKGLDQAELDESLLNAGFDVQSSSLDDSDTAFGATVGYLVNDNFARRTLVC